MSTVQARLYLLALMAAMALCGLCHAQDIHPDIAANAHYSTADQGWSCNDGFKQVAGFCVRDDLNLPSQNAFEFYDGQWRCQAGYRRANGICVLPTAPEHATLVGQGDRWECDWGFKAAGPRCEEIVPPAHAFLDASGRDWTCFPGFDRVADRCEPKPAPDPQAAAQ